MLDPWMKAPHMDLVERHRTDPGHEPLQPTYIIINASLMLVLDHLFRCRLLEGPKWPDAVDSGLPDLFHQACEILLRFREASRSSALAYSPPLDPLVDVRYPAPPEEARNSFASHVRFPFLRDARCGRHNRRTMHRVQLGQSRHLVPRWEFR
jgi:hypothetical protein